jgi:hypothetical protein
MINARYNPRSVSLNRDFGLKTSKNVNFNHFSLKLSFFDHGLNSLRRKGSSLRHERSSVRGKGSSVCRGLDSLRHRGSSVGHGLDSVRRKGSSLCHRLSSVRRKGSSLRDGLDSLRDGLDSVHGGLVCFPSGQKPVFEGIMHISDNPGMARHSVRAVGCQPTRSAGRTAPPCPFCPIVCDVPNSFRRLIYPRCCQRRKTNLIPRT